MESIYDIIEHITLPDENARAAAKRQWDSLAKPLGSLGLFEKTVTKLAALRGDTDVRLDDRRLLVFCADNGVVRQGVTQCESAVTAKVAAALAEGRSSVNPMARHANCRVIPVDVGILNFPGHPDVLNRRIRNGTDDLSLGPAMTRDECLAAMEAGAALAMENAAEGASVLLIGEMGIGNTTSAAAVYCALLGLDPAAAAGRGAGLSNDGVRRKRKAIARALQINKPDPDDPVDVLSKVGGLDLAAMCGAYLGAAACNTPAVIDGYISAAAALCALRMCPIAEKALLPSHSSGEQNGAGLLEALGLKAPIHAQMRLGEGSGAVMLLPLLDMALSLYNSGQSFDRLGIEAYKPQE
ncbi:MAG: nicotinate-nucleotide--dimethylbenzimidazole phosphoribosyltransferase [Oscillospiraceae bacterium]|nr:nicotinate-nucleotide--dimethylbenzimidazole phosphoribosyltransferase [Oscillospiraceae bacterium]